MILQAAGLPHCAIEAGNVASRTYMVFDYLNTRRRSFKIGKSSREAYVVKLRSTEMTLPYTINSALLSLVNYILPRVPQTKIYIVLS